MLTEQFALKALEKENPNNVDARRRENKRGLRESIVDVARKCMDNFNLDLDQEEESDTLASAISGAVGSTHSSFVKEAIQRYGANKLLKRPPPKPPDEVDRLEKGLSRAERVKLAQMRSGYCTALGDYRKRIGVTTNDKCRRCNRATETVRHALQCRGARVEDLWLDPHKIARCTDDI